VVTVLAGATVALAVRPANAALGFEVESLNGRGNNVVHPTWGMAGTNYLRFAPANYADGRSQMVDGPNARMVSNRIFQDLGQNIFSEHRATQWLWTWGQYVDHHIGLREENGDRADIPFYNADPLERFTNTLGVIPFNRSKAAPGTGVTNVRQHVNTERSYLDGDGVYGPTNSRLEWLREGPVDNDLRNNGPKLMLPGGYLPTRDARGDVNSAPDAAVDGRLAATPNRARIAGDVRANENIALTATHTLYAREHNRIVSKLPNTLTDEEKFQIARRVVIAEEQYVTYHEFLPAMGVNLPAYTGYKPNVDGGMGHEFATSAYRMHSMIHGEFEVDADADRYTPDQIAALQKAGVVVTPEGDEVSLGVSLNIAFFNPDLLNLIGLGPMLQAIGGEPQYKNDEQFDNHLRSVLFQVPISGNPECLDDPSKPACFKGVLDLAALDIQRDRDHGMPRYNDMRRAFGLPPKTSFTAITGESSEAFPPGSGVDDPTSLDFTHLFDINGKEIPLGSEDAAMMTRGVRKTPLAARLKAVYGSPDNMDAFVGIVAERHLPGSELGELQNAIVTKQFLALRDADRFFYGNDPALEMIKQQYGIDFRQNLGDTIAANTDIPRADMNDNVFLVKDEQIPAGTTCSVTYHVDSTWDHAQQVSVKITNLSPTPINGWTLTWWFPTGQTITQLWNGAPPSQSGAMVTVRNASWNAVIPGNGGVLNQVGFNGTWDNATNADPPNILLNGRRCART